MHCILKFPSPQRRSNCPSCGGRVEVKLYSINCWWVHDAACRFRDSPAPNLMTAADLPRVAAACPNLVTLDFNILLAICQGMSAGLTALAELKHLIHFTWCVDREYSRVDDGLSEALEAVKGRWPRVSWSRHTTFLQTSWSTNDRHLMPGNRWSHTEQHSQCGDVQPFGKAAIGWCRGLVSHSNLLGTFETSQLPAANCLKYCCSWGGCQGLDKFLSSRIGYGQPDVRG